MSGAPEPPKTEAVLLLSLPPSNLPGVFPRDLLTGDERILYETRPSLLGLYVGRMIVLALFLLLFIYATVGLPLNPATWFFDAVFLGLLVYLVLLWRASAYAISDRRVLKLGGIRRTDFLDATYDQVQNLRLESGFSGGIKFDATPPHAPTGLLSGRKYAKTIYWRALPNPPQVLTYVQQAFALHEHQVAQTGLREMLIARMRQDRLPCAYCGTLVDIKTVDYASPKCPNCGAPLVEPGK